MKKIFILLLAGGGFLVIAAIVVGVIVFVVPGFNSVNDKLNGNGTENTTGDGSSAGPCKREKVTLENYGDKGTRLESCFVEYPGEPTREDKSYYIVEDICGQFTKDFVEYITGEKIVGFRAPTSSSVYACTYFMSGTADDPVNSDFYLIVLDYLNFERQKSAHESFGRKISTDQRIQMDHFISTQEDGNINRIVLKLSDDKFLGLDRGSGSSVSNDDLLNFAIKLSENIKNYK